MLDKNLRMWYKGSMMREGMRKKRGQSDANVGWPFFVLKQKKKERR